MTLAGRRQSPLHSSLGISGVRTGCFVCRESASLTISQFRFLQLRHAAMTARIKRKC